MLRKFGHIVTVHRRSRLLTQKQLAIKAGLHVNYIGKLECGLTNPGLLSILRIALALGVHAETLMMQLRLSRYGNIENKN